MSAGTPVTAEMLADAFGCFWNATLAHQHATVEANIVEGFNAISIRLNEFAAEAQKKPDRFQQILKGVLCEDGNSSVYITFNNSQWELIAATQQDGPVHEVMCCHEDWNQFIDLVAEYSDYVEGE